MHAQPTVSHVRQVHAAAGNAQRATRVLGACALVLSATAACEKHEFERPSREAQVAQADSLLTAETFDTVTWVSDSARAFDGNNAYAANCRTCHGPLGEGDTEYARQRNLDPPSLIRADWPYADIASVRHRIFVGHPEGMPTWGVAGITPREIDAIAYYIVHILRPEAAAGGE